VARPDATTGAVDHGGGVLVLNVAENLDAVGAVDVPRRRVRL